MHGLTLQRTEDMRTVISWVMGGALACFATAARAQSVDTFDLGAVGKDARWKVVGRTAATVDIKGKRALEISGGTGMGVVWLDGYDFGNGVIDVDLVGRREPGQGSFLAIAVRRADAPTLGAVSFPPL